MSINFGKLFGAAPERVAAYRLYVSLVEQARRPEFYTDLGVSDTATGRFDVIALHAFLVMRRLRAEPEAAVLAQALTDAVVDDMDRNLREMGAGDLSVGKKVKRLMQGFYGRLKAYDESVFGDDAALAAALKRNLYAEETSDEARLAAMAAYVRRESEALLSQPMDRLAQGAVAFGPPPVLAREKVD